MLLDGFEERLSEAETALLAYTGEDEVTLQTNWNLIQLELVDFRSTLMDQRIPSILFAVVGLGRLDLLQKLLKILGGDEGCINERDFTGRTALMAACSSKGDQAGGMVDLLLEYGADALARDCNGDSAIDHAMKAGKHGVVQRLRRSAAEMHYLYSPPHYKAFLWMNGADMLSPEVQSSPIYKASPQHERACRIVIQCSSCLSHVCSPILGWTLSGVGTADSGGTVSNALQDPDRDVFIPRRPETGPPPIYSSCFVSTRASRLRWWWVCCRVILFCDIGGGWWANRTRRRLLSSDEGPFAPSVRD